MGLDVLSSVNTARRFPCSIPKAPPFLLLPAHNTCSYFTNLHHDCLEHRSLQQHKQAKAENTSYSLINTDSDLQAAVNPSSCAPWNQPQSPAKDRKCPKDDAQTQNQGIWHQKKANIAFYAELMHAEPLKGCGAGHDGIWLGAINIKAAFNKAFFPVLQESV